MARRRLEPESIYDWAERFVTSLPIVVPSPHLHNEERQKTGQEHNLEAIEDALMATVRDPVVVECTDRLAAVLDTYMRVVARCHDLLPEVARALGIEQTPTEITGAPGCIGGA